ncbi:MAG: hypothetical protein QM564_13320 [Bergeyella sp.]
MRIIIIEDTVYKVSEKEYKKILEVQKEADNLPFGGDLHMDEYLYSNKDKYKEIGVVDFDFRL